MKTAKIDWSMTAGPAYRANCLGLAVRGVQAHCAGDALQLNRPNLRKTRSGAFRSVDHVLADDYLPGSRILGDPRSDVHGLAEVIALLEDDRAGVQADMRRRQPGAGGT